MKTVSVYIVDDHTLFRNGLKLLLNAIPGIQVVGEAVNGREFLESFTGLRSDVVLMDIDMPVMDGIEATKAVLTDFPDTRIIALSMYADEEYYYKMIHAGVKGFLLKNSDIGELKTAIQTVNEGGTHFSEEILLSLLKNIQSVHQSEIATDNLSDREKDVLRLICEGLSTNEIAEKLVISKRTVDKHRSNILEKTSSKNTASLIVYAMKNKIIEI